MGYTVYTSQPNATPLAGIVLHVPFQVPQRSDSVIMANLPSHGPPSTCTLMQAITMGQCAKPRVAWRRTGNPTKAARSALHRAAAKLID
ncbi:hypothetical protein E4U31_006064 [Claviceps sp. LM219 group G6]|nr:hypothetical protein E4U31_006064 [Claviceps sp. LM219 group G6]